MVRLLSNGYLLNEESFRINALKCDEVIGEIKAINETDFQKLQRPIKGYTLEQHIANMVLFNNKFDGKFILEVTIIKDKSDSTEQVSRLKNLMKLIDPDEVIITTMDGVFEKKLGVTPDKLDDIKVQLL